MHMYESYSHAIQYGRVIAFLVKNHLFTPVTPNDPRMTFNPIIKVEGRKLMHMNESYGHVI